MEEESILAFMLHQRLCQQTLQRSYKHAQRYRQHKKNLERRANNNPNNNNNTSILEENKTEDNIVLTDEYNTGYVEEFDRNDTGFTDTHMLSNHGIVSNNSDITNDFMNTYSGLPDQRPLTTSVSSPNMIMRNDNNMRSLFFLNSNCVCVVYYVLFAVLFVCLCVVFQFKGFCFVLFCLYFWGNDVCLYSSNKLETLL